MKLKQLLILGMSVSLLTLGCGSGAGNSIENDKTQSETTKSEETKSDKAQVSSTEREIFAMDTYMTLVAYGDRAEEAVDAAVSEIEALDALLSTGKADSEISVLNENGEGNLSPVTYGLVERSIELYEKTGGVFDIAIYPVMEAWGFPTGDYRVPTGEELTSLLASANPSFIQLDPEESYASFGGESMKIDLGGIAKGYTSTRVVEIFKEYGIENGMINLGGNVQVLGKKTDGTLWRIGIQNPENNSNYLGVLSVADRAVITSGGYERYFEEDGNHYHHIIDPETGYPADNGLISVTVVSEDGTLADALSTSLFIMGQEKAIEFWRNSEETFDFILETEEYELYVTEGIAKEFETDYELEIVEK